MHRPLLSALLLCSLPAVVPAVAAVVPEDASNKLNRSASTSASPVQLPEMVWIAGGEFVMGGVGPEARMDEFPQHKVRVSSFWMDKTEVTNDQFRRFVQDTGYITTAEKPVDWETLKLDSAPGTARPRDDQLLPGSLVFAPPAERSSSCSSDEFWTYRIGANWRHPDGPATSIEGKGNHPVVQVSYTDALAYCRWAGKRLPTEAEWEYAARGGMVKQPFVWGDKPISARRSNTWQGTFPVKNTCEDGYLSTCPTLAFPANRYGLFGMSGNVWEWCSDYYKPTTYIEQLRSGTTLVDPSGPPDSYDSRHRYAREVRVLRGGSYLCHRSYCSSYRPSARMSSTPDTSMPHVGFRCAKSGG